MPTNHDAVALAGCLWRSPAAYRMYLRGQSAARLAVIDLRDHELPPGHRQALQAERDYRRGRSWMQDGAGAE